MDDEARRNFARGLCGSLKPEDVDDIYVTVYDHLCDKWHSLLGNRACTRNEWAMVAMLAEALKERDDKIAALGKAIEELKAGNNGQDSAGRTRGRPPGVKANG